MGGVPGGEPFVMVQLSAQRRISRPAAILGCGSAGVTGGFGGLFGGVPIVTVSMNFGQSHLCCCHTFNEDSSLFRFFMVVELGSFAASCNFLTVGILGQSFLPPFREHGWDPVACWEGGGARFLWAVLLLHVCFVEGVPGLEGFSGGIMTYSL